MTEADDALEKTRSLRRPPLQRGGGIRNLAPRDDGPRQPSASARPPATAASGVSTTGGDDASNPSKIHTPIHVPATPAASPGKGGKKVLVVQNMPVRNKVKQDQTFEGLLEMQRRIERATQDATDGAHTDLLEHCGGVVEIISSIQETNRQNESLIQKLQRQLVVVTRERDDARRDSNELAGKIYQERKCFADVSHNHKKEVDALERKLKKLGKKCKRMEIDSRVKDETIRFWEVSRAMENLGGGGTTTAAVAATPAADGTASAASEATSDGEGEGRKGASEKTSETTEAVAVTPTANKTASATSEAASASYGEEEGGAQNSTSAKTFKTMEAEVEYWIGERNKMGTVNDELVDKICQISDENSELFTKCQKLEDQLASCNASPLRTLRTRRLGDEEGHNSASEIETLKSEASYWKEERNKMDIINDELVDKIGRIADENSQLLAKCQTLEGKLASSDESSLGIMHLQKLARHVEESSSDMQAENAALHRSMDEAIQLASDNIAQFYEDKLSTLNDELAQALLSREDLLMENVDLCAMLEKACDGARESNARGGCEPSETTRESRPAPRSSSIFLSSCTHKDL